MADLDSITKQEQEDEHQGTKKAIMGGVDLVIYAVVGFCEVLYVAMLIPAFPDGLVRLVAIGGACATGLSTVLLLKGKLYWFTKGKQSHIAWAFVAVEIIILALNVMLAVQLHNGHVVDWMQWWEGFYPAAPVVAIVGWGLVLYTDQSNVMRTRRRVQLEKQETAEMDYERLVHATKMEVKHNSLQILSDKLQAKISSASHSAGLDRIADEMSNAILGEISGQHVSSFLLPPPSNQIVEADDDDVSPMPPVQPPVQAAAAPPATTTPIDYDALAEALTRTGAFPVVQQQQQLPLTAPNPFAHPHLPTTTTSEASQAGTNGNSNGHQQQA